MKTKPIPPSLAKWRTLEIALLRIYDGRIRSGANSASPSKNSTFRAWLLRAGVGEIGIGSFSHTILPGHWFLPPQEISWQSFSPDTELLSLNFRATWPDGRLLFDLPQGVGFKGMRFPGVETAALQIKRIVDMELSGTAWFLERESLDLDSFLALEEALRGWLLALSKVLSEMGIHPSKIDYGDERVELGLEWLRNLPLNFKFREQQLATFLGISVVHLNRLFTREAGMSPVEILERRRLAHATNLLNYTQVPIKQLSYDLGFCSPSHFIAWFRSKIGKTPREYRKQRE